MARLDPRRALGRRACTSRTAAGGGPCRCNRASKQANTPRRLGPVGREADAANAVKGRGRCPMWAVSAPSQKIRPATEQANGKGDASRLRKVGSQPAEHGCERAAASKWPARPRAFLRTCGRRRQVVVAQGFGGIYRIRTIGCCNEVTLKNQHETNAALGRFHTR
jgi:hypothetical protein